jgi:hypothetical protein
VAKHTVIELEDDLSGGPAEETVTFGLDGTSFDIDLNAENASRLRDSMAEFVTAARKAGGRAGSRGIPRPRAAASDAAVSAGLKEDAAAIREWAKAAGHEVSARGRIAQRIRDAYRQSLG